MTGRIYYVKRAGWRVEIWWSYQDGRADPANGATAWQAARQRFWRRISALRAANDMWHAYNDGVFAGRCAEIDAGRAALAGKEEG
ncbi:hypothetical protein [Rhodoligotrophos defluvii]|uniref:hypothetical protein n=1 Tax=Rhodoligotrophos defluvii TaxID=2561934 RepID=UPI0010C9A659|nr:hypothetical protein [Rhodoligotrophos defluvii]